MQITLSERLPEDATSQWAVKQRAFRAAETCYRRAAENQTNSAAHEAALKALDRAAADAALHIEWHEDVIDDKREMGRCLVELCTMYGDAHLQGLAEVVIASIAQTLEPGCQPTWESGQPSVAADWAPAARFWRAYGLIEVSPEQASRDLGQAVGAVMEGRPSTPGELADKTRIIAMIGAMKALEAGLLLDPSLREDWVERVAVWMAAIPRVRAAVLLAALADCRSPHEISQAAVAANEAAKIQPLVLMRLCMDQAEPASLQRLRQDGFRLGIPPRLPVGRPPL